MKNIKTLFLSLIFLATSFVHAQDSSMILSNAVILTASATDENEPTNYADFYINNHRVVQNTSVDMHSIENTQLKVKTVKENVEGDRLIVNYSLNSKPYLFLEKTSLSAFPEKTAYVTVDKIEYKGNKAIVFISVLDKSHHAEMIKAHENGGTLLLGIVAFLAFLMLLFMLSL